MLALPVFDALRVMKLRISQGKNPMSPDRQHVHHLLLDSDYGALRIDLILSLLTVGLVFVVLAIYDIPQILGFMFEFIAMGLLLIFFRYVRYVNNEHSVNAEHRGG
jgi:hypothetical protein